MGRHTLTEQLDGAIRGRAHRHGVGDDFGVLIFDRAVGALAQLPQQHIHGFTST